jgi:DHA3 family tetracycline resistance protein-like MFS transporter
MSFIKIPRLDSVPVYLVMMGAGEMFLLTYGVLSSVYRIKEAGLNPLQLVLVGTVLEASVFLFEVPTGIIADVYSRRLSIIIGFLLMGAGFIVEGLFPVFGIILVGQVLWGVGATFTSGAQQAWLADEVGNQGVGRIFVRGSQFGQIGGLVGIGIGTALGSLALGLPLVAAGALMMGLALFLALAMPERGFRPAPRQERQTWHDMARTLRGGVHAVRFRPVLAIILVIAVIYGAANEPIDRLWPIHLLTSFTFPALGDGSAVLWFGIIGAAGRVLGIGVTDFISRRFDVDSSQTAVRTLFALNVLHVASIAAIALAGSFALAVSAFLISSVIRRVTDPLLDTWTNQHVDSSVRATVFSLRGQGDAIGQIAFGPVMGALATVSTIRAALVGVAVMLVAPLFLYILTARREGQAEATE